MVNEAIRAIAAEWELQGGDAARLLGQERWVCWRKRPKEGGGFSKPPVNIAYPRGDKVIPANIRPGAVYESGNRKGQLKPVCLYAFDRAVAALEAGICDGVGIATGEIDGVPLCGLDMDGVFDEKGRPLPEWAETIDAVARAGYCEISPSGRGLRGLALCRKPEGYREKADVDGHDVEVRFDGHYMTLTGERPEWAAAPLSADDSAVKLLCERHLKVSRPDKPTGGKASPPDYLSVGLERDAALRRCWAGEFDGGDESANDLTLMNKLAYWCGRDIAAMVEAFRASPYAQGKDEAHARKLDRRDYLQRTAEKAVQGCRETAADADERFRARRDFEQIPPPDDRDLPAGVSWAGEAVERVKKETSVAPFDYIDAQTLLGTEFPPTFQPVERFIVEGLTFIVGASKIGKSWFTLLMCIQIAKGEDFLGMKTTQCPVMYLALEDGEKRLKDRIRKLLDGTPPPSNLLLCTQSQVMDTGFEWQLDDWFSRYNGKTLVVVDTFQKVRGISKGNVNLYQSDYDVVSKLKAVADRHRGALVGIHHTNKLRNVTDPFEKVSGSNGIMGAADTTILIEGERGGDTATVKFQGRDVWGDDKLIRFNDCRWELVSNNATAFNEKEEYERNPLVQLFRKLITENPRGGRWTYEELKTAGLDALGTYPFLDGKDCGKKLNAGLAAELRNRDGILIECGARVKGARGVIINPVPLQRDFQTTL